MAYIMLRLVQENERLMVCEPLGPLRVVLEEMKGHVLQCVLEQGKVPGGKGVLELLSFDLTRMSLRFLSRLKLNMGFVENTGFVVFLLWSMCQLDLRIL